MSANQVFLIAFAISVIGALVLMPVSVKCGLKWAKIADVSFIKAFGLYLLILLANCFVAILAIGAYFIFPLKPLASLLNVLDYFTHFIAASLVIAFIYKARISRAAIAVIPFVLAGVAVVLFAYVVRIHVYEGFLIPTNAMAPTLLGVHYEAPCPKCGKPAYGSILEPGRPLQPDGLPLVCSNELTTVYVTKKPRENDGGDRILVCKLLQPKRWDIIVFRHPENGATVNYAKRLVGLPGEKLEIRDGAIWINGNRLEPPEMIRGIHYSPTIESYGRVISGPGSMPVELGPDDYFVLGDFVDQSSDSRFWEEGAPGHPPYAVPGSHIVGVVINIYWPPARWTSFH